MDHRDFLRNAAQAGLLVTALRSVLADGALESADPYAEFYALPIYRCYVRALPYHELPLGWPAALAVPQALDLLKEPDNPHDRRAIAVYAEGTKVGFLPREDNLILEKLTRRGLPVTCRLVGVQPEEEIYRSLSVEVALLYPRHATTDTAIESAEADRRSGLQKVGDQPSYRRRVTGDPLSAGHVYDGYYGEGFGGS